MTHRLVLEIFTVLGQPSNSLDLSENLSCFKSKRLFMMAPPPNKVTASLQLHSTITVDPFHFNSTTRTALHIDIMCAGTSISIPGTIVDDD